MSEPTDQGARYRELLNRWDRIETQIEEARTMRDVFERLGDRSQAREAGDEIAFLMEQQDLVSAEIAALAEPEGQS